MNRTINKKELFLRPRLLFVVFVFFSTFLPVPERCECHEILPVGLFNVAKGQPEFLKIIEGPKPRSNGIASQGFEKVSTDDQSVLYPFESVVLRSLKNTDREIQKNNICNFTRNSSVANRSPADSAGFDTPVSADRPCRLSTFLLFISIVFSCGLYLSFSFLKTSPKRVDDSKLEKAAAKTEKELKHATAGKKNWWGIFFSGTLLFFIPVLLAVSSRDPDTLLFFFLFAIYAVWLAVRRLKLVSCFCFVALTGVAHVFFIYIMPLLIRPFTAKHTLVYCGIILLSLWIISQLWTRYDRKVFAGKRVIPMVSWLAEAYLHRADWMKLDKLLSQADMLQGIDESQLVWFKANLYVRQKKEDLAIRILESTIPSEKTDGLLIELYVKRSQKGKARERLKAYTAEKAISLIETVPRSKIRDLLLVELWVQNNQWKLARCFLQAQPPEEAIDLLEKLEPGEDRNSELIPLLYQAGEDKKILDIMAVCDAHRGLERLKRLLPSESRATGIMIRFLVEKENFEKIEILLQEMPGREAIELLGEFDASDRIDQVICKLCVKSRDVDALLDYFPENRSEEAIRFLLQCEESIHQKRAISRFFYRLGNFKKVIFFLKPHPSIRHLSDEDLRLVAACYRKTNKNDQAFKALSAAWKRKPGHPDTLRELIIVSQTLKQFCPALSNIPETAFGELSADDLRKLIHYYHSFKKFKTAFLTAKYAFQTHKDEKAAIYLGRVYERNGKLHNAAEFYKYGGETGKLPQAMCLFRIGDYKQTVPILRHVYERQYPVSEAVAYHLGFSLCQTGGLNEASGVFDRMDPDRKDSGIQKDLTVVSVKIAKAQIEKKEYEAAVVSLKKALTHNLDTGSRMEKKINDALAICCYQLARGEIINPESNGKKAKRLFADIKKYKPGPWRESEFLEGLFHLKNNSPDTALRRFAMLGKRFSNTPQILFHKALAAVGVGNHSYAAKILHSLVEIKRTHPYKARSNVLLGIIALRDMNYELAERRLKKVYS